MICKCQSAIFVRVRFRQYAHLHIMNYSQIQKLVEMGFALKSLFDALDRNLKVKLTEGNKSAITFTATYKRIAFQICIRKISDYNQGQDIGVMSEVSVDFPRFLEKSTEISL
jgi:hypothetical protein